jgi:Na+/alanine symporter
MSAYIISYLQFYFVYFDKHLIDYHDCQYNLFQAVRIITYTSFIGMYMSGENHIRFVLYEPFLEQDTHGISFHVLVVVTVVAGTG